MFFIVDSDDFLPLNSLETINKVWLSIPIEEKKKFAGIGGRKYSLNTGNKNFNFYELYQDLDAISFNLVYGNIQDKAEVYVTKIIKQYKFPEFSDEKFMTESVVWFKLAQDGYKIRWFNEDIYICEYQENGLSKSFYKQRVNSINGTCHSYNLLSSYDLPPIYKLRYKINYFRYGLVKKKWGELYEKLIDKKWGVICLMAGYIIYWTDTKIKKYGEN